MATKKLSAGLLTLILRMFSKLISDPIVTRSIGNTIEELDHYKRVVSRYPNSVSADAKRLHLACGSDLKSGWLNMDLMHECDLRVDVRRKLPFEDATFEAIYISHAIDCLEYPNEVRSFLGECHRILRKSGVLRIANADFEFLVRNVLDHEKFQTWKAESQRLGWGYPEWCVEPIDFINYFSMLNKRDCKRKFGFTYSNISRIGESVGFEPSVSEFDRDIDLAGRAIGSMYVNLIKR